MLHGHRVRLVDAFRVFDANNSKRLGAASTYRCPLPSCPRLPMLQPIHMHIHAFRFSEAHELHHNIFCLFCPCLY